MNDKPEIPAGSGDKDQYRAETPRSEGNPTANMGDAYAPPPPPSYSQAPAQPPQYEYNLPQQGQPEPYTPPPAYPPPPPSSGYGQGQQGAPTVNTGGQPPVYQPGQYGGGSLGAAYGYAPPKDPTMGLLLELIGYVGFLGIGHIWAGKTTRGIVLLVGYWVYIIFSSIMVLFLVGCLMLAAALIVPIASGLYLKSEMEREQAAMGIRR